uniref:Uncharacterized protein n=1 Tax=Nelumbo nucifera TaxID=4432 RepID=A0A822ZGG8_NELNU|nr:TPA_asm: hypothetical protein HUJ06_002207 [Nelumbo nucifera]
MQIPLVVVGGFNHKLWLLVEVAAALLTSNCAQPKLYQTFGVEEGMHAFDRIWCLKKTKISR